MKIKRRQKINKPLVAVISILALGLVGFLTYSLIYKPLTDKPAETTSTNETSTDKQQSENLKTNPENKEKAPNTDHPTDPVVTNGSDKKQVQMIASVDRSGGSIYIRGGVNYPVSGGSCYAQLSGPSGQSVRKNSTVLSNPASTDCKTIEIPSSELAPGKWTFKLNYTSNEYEGVSDEIPFSI